MQIKNCIIKLSIDDSRNLYFKMQYVDDYKEMLFKAKSKNQT